MEINLNLTPNDYFSTVVEVINDNTIKEYNICVNNLKLQEFLNLISDDLKKTKISQENYRNAIKLLFSQDDAQKLIDETEATKSQLIFLSKISKNISKFLSDISKSEFSKLDKFSCSKIILDIKK